MSAKNITRIFPVFHIDHYSIGFSLRAGDPNRFRFPYREEGLSDRQAAAHLLEPVYIRTRPG